jgi:hypothetical protein
MISGTDTAVSCTEDVLSSGGLDVHLRLAAGVSRLALLPFLACVLAGAGNDDTCTEGGCLQRLARRLAQFRPSGAWAGQVCHLMPHVQTHLEEEYVCLHRVQWTWCHLPLQIKGMWLTFFGCWQSGQRSMRMVYSNERLVKVCSLGGLDIQRFVRVGRSAGVSNLMPFQAGGPRMGMEVLGVM